MVISFEELKEIGPPWGLDFVNDFFCYKNWHTDFLIDFPFFTKKW
jgi:hypothetical protein